MKITQKFTSNVLESCRFNGKVLLKKITNTEKNPEQLKKSLFILASINIVNTVKKITGTEKKYIKKHQPAPEIYTKKEIKQKNIEKWVKKHEEILEGSCIFCRDRNYFVSNLIEDLTKCKCDKNKEFIPAHVSSIYKKGEELMVLNVEAPTCWSCTLVEFLKNKPDDYRLVMRNFDLDKNIYNKFIQSYENEPYSLKAAIQSIIKPFKNSTGVFCSKSHVEALQAQGIINGYNPNKVTPHLLYHLMTEKDFKDKNPNAKYLCLNV